MAFFIKSRRFRPRRSTKRSFRKRTTFRKKRSSKKPTRYWGTKGRPRRQIALTSLAKSLSALAETKLLSYNQQDRVPRIWSSNNKMAQFMFNLGHQNLQGQSIPMNGANPSTSQGIEMFNIPPLQYDPSGVAINPTSSREGNSVYIKHNITKFMISMRPVIKDLFTEADPLQVTDILKQYSQPIAFRLLVVRPNRKNTNTAPNPAVDLFRGEDGLEYGVQTTIPLTQLKLKTSLINTRKYNVLRDQKFKLSPQMVYAEDVNDVVDTPGAHQITSSALSQNTTRHPFSKMFRVKVPVNKKVFYSAKDTTNLDPQNYNDGTFIVIIASFANDRVEDIGSGVYPDNWCVDTLSTTAYSDM